MITTTDNQESLMRRYLLGNLPEPEQLTLEAGFFADGNLLQQVQEIETDLVDEYVRGTMPKTEQQQFELHYLTTPDHKERVAFARQLLQAANEQAVPQPAHSKESLLEKLLAALRAPQFAWGAAATAVVLLVAVTVWLNNQKAVWQQQLSQSQSERSTEQQRIRELETQIAQQNERNAELSAELADLNQRLRAEPKPTVTQSLFSFILLSGVRGGGEQQTLKLPSGTAQIQLQVKLESQDYQRYSASIRPVDGGRSWGPQAASATTSSSGTTVSVKIPASKFSNGDYILTLTGVNATGIAEEINRYSFRFAK
jgi:cell division protein FtsL